MKKRMFAVGSKVMDGIFMQQLMLTLTHFMMSLSWKCRLTQQLNSLWHYDRIDKIIPSTQKHLPDSHTPPPLNEERPRM